MNVNLTPELESLVHSKVKTGRYNSASEVVREALRMMEDRDQMSRIRLEEFRRKIADGLSSLERGKGIDGGEFMSRMIDDINAEIVADAQTRNPEIHQS